MKKRRQLALDGGEGALLERDTDPARSLLRRARALLEERGWVQHTWRNSNGNCVGNAILGGTGERGHPTPLQNAALALLVKAIPPAHNPFPQDDADGCDEGHHVWLDYVVSYNDSRLQTQQGALRWIDRALEID